MNQVISFKNLEVWQRSISLACDILDICENLHSNRKHYRLIEQIEAASASISANIAEGRGRSSQKEFRQFLCIARGSLFETLSFLYLFGKKGWINENQLLKIESEAVTLAKKLNALIHKLTPANQPIG